VFCVWFLFFLFDSFVFCVWFLFFLFDSLPYAASEELQRQLVRAGARVELLPFSGGHGIDPELLPAVAAFVQRCLGAAG